MPSRVESGSSAQKFISGSDSAKFNGVIFSSDIKYNDAKGSVSVSDFNETNDAKGNSFKFKCGFSCGDTIYSIHSNVAKGHFSDNFFKTSNDRYSKVNTPLKKV